MGAKETILTAEGLRKLEERIRKSSFCKTSGSCRAY